MAERHNGRRGFTPVNVAKIKYEAQKRRDKGSPIRASPSIDTGETR